MQTAERIDVITRCAKRLAAGRGWGEIDFILSQFQMPTTDMWQGGRDDGLDQKFEYVRDMLNDPGGHLDFHLKELDSYLAGTPDTAPQDAPWESDRFRLFLSHIALEKEYATELKRCLAYWGIDAFVAHEDIEPGLPWRREIIAALHSCDALLAILQTGFRESDYCVQEVGIALGRPAPVVSLKIDFDPYGFFGELQAIAARGLSPEQVAQALTVLLLQDKQTGTKMTHCLSTALRSAYSFDMANALSGLLASHAGLLTVADLDILREGHKVNGQLSSAWMFEQNFNTMASVIGQRGLSTPAPVGGGDFGYDEEPF